MGSKLKILKIASTTRFVVSIHPETWSPVRLVNRDEVHNELGSTGLKANLLEEDSLSVQEIRVRMTSGKSE